MLNHVERCFAYGFRMVLGHLCVAWCGILEELGKGDVAGYLFPVSEDAHKDVGLKILPVMRLLLSWIFY